MDRQGRLTDHCAHPKRVPVATALLIREDLDVLLSYDVRLTAAAAAHGLTTATPR